VSLILDALRKADAERERGSVPGLHSQADGPPDRDVRTVARSRPWMWMVAGVVGAGLLAVVAWVLLGRDAPRVAPAAAPPLASAGRGAVVPAPAPAPVTAPPSPPVTSAEAEPAPVAADAPAEPAPWPQADARKAPVRRAAEAGAAANPTGASGGTAAPAAVAAADVVLPTREQLPDAIRAQLPELTFGGSIFSSNAANRSLIVNGRLYRENEALNGDLQLEQIRAKSAVLRFKGQRFEVRF
jgi:general secretion pathway protein B